MNQLLRTILAEVAPERVDELLPVVEQCISEAVTPRSLIEREIVPMRAIPGPGGSGIELMKQATELPFPEFVAKLITGTFDAIVASHIKQSEAYSQLVAQLLSEVADFEANNISTADANKWLVENYPDANDATKTSVTETGAYDQAIYDELVGVRLANIWAAAGDTSDKSKLAQPSPPTGSTWGNIAAEIRAGVRRYLAKSGLAQIQAMARDGMQFVAVTNGEITARLTFNVTAFADQSSSESSSTTTNRGGAIGGSAVWRWLNISGSYGGNTLRVESANKSTYSRTTMDAQLFGEVKLQFQTRTLPLIELR